ncbi:hypothetical protein VNO77_09061 [Canavalia gladiata]|uniref:Uncharacterized protein n=1 Tax=Canavalia gladiata TaxID=3824 RepID=A0AAN9M9M8_CANGL
MYTAEDWVRVHILAPKVPKKSYALMVLMPPSDSVDNGTCIELELVEVIADQILHFLGVEGPKNHTRANTFENAIVEASTVVSTLVKFGDTVNVLKPCILALLK